MYQGAIAYLIEHNNSEVSIKIEPGDLIGGAIQLGGISIL